jgi:hypothetical protein
VGSAPILSGYRPPRAVTRSPDERGHGEADVRPRTRSHGLTRLVDVLRHGALEPTGATQTIDRIAELLEQSLDASRREGDQHASLDRPRVRVRVGCTSGRPKPHAGFSSEAFAVDLDGERALKHEKGLLVALVAVPARPGIDRDDPVHQRVATPRIDCSEHRIRDYALERLRAEDDIDAVRRRHATYFAQWSAEAGAGLRGPHEADWVDLIDLEMENLRTALLWSLEARDADLSTALVAPLMLEILPTDETVGGWAEQCLTLAGIEAHALYAQVAAFAAYALVWRGRLEDGRTGRGSTGPARSGTGGLGPSFACPVRPPALSHGLLCGGWGT